MESASQSQLEYFCHTNETLLSKSDIMAASFGSCCF